MINFNKTGNEIVTFRHRLTCVVREPLFKPGMQGHDCLHYHLTDSCDDKFGLTHAAMYQFQLGFAVFLCTCTFN
jgi:hypothetical protein